MKIDEVVIERYNLDLALTTKQVDDLERFADRLLNKFGINIELGYHFKDRMADDRNHPPIKISEIQALFKKIAKDKGKKILQQQGHEAILKDIQSDLNLPMVLTPTYDSLDVKIKTVMRKKDFKSYDDTVVYERKKKKKKKSHYSGHGYYGGLFGDGTSTSDSGAVGESIALDFHTIELEQHEIKPYIKQFFESYNINRHHIASVSNIKRFARLAETQETKDVAPFINAINSVDTTEQIKVGDNFSVLAFEIISAWKEINASGFTTPKEVVDIKMHGDKINYILFSDGDRYPRLTPATYQGKPVIQTAYFDNKQSANQALTVLSLKVPDQWTLNTDDVDTNKNISECSGYIPKNDKEAKDPRWSMALTDDVRPGEEQRNLKKLGLK